MCMRVSDIAYGICFEYKNTIDTIVIIEKISRRIVEVTKLFNKIKLKFKKSD